MPKVPIHELFSDIMVLLLEGLDCCVLHWYVFRLSQNLAKHKLGRQHFPELEYCELSATSGAVFVNETHQRALEVSLRPFMMERLLHKYNNDVII